MSDQNFVGPRLTLESAIRWFEVALRDAALHQFEYDRVLMNENNKRVSHFEMARAMQESGSIVLNALKIGDYHEVVRYAQLTGYRARDLITGEYGDRYRDHALWSVISRISWLIAALHYEKWEQVNNPLEKWERELLSMNND